MYDELLDAAAAAADDCDELDVDFGDVRGD